MHPDALEIERLNRLYSALTLINQAIVRIPTREALFQRICDVLVAQGGLRIAWIGWPGADARVVPVAEAGDRGGYLKRIAVYADDRPEGRGPTGTAMRENRPYVCNDLFADPASLPWRQELERSGLRASAVFPIHFNGAVSGALNVYSDQAGFFRDKELALLVEAATDLSFALENKAKEDALAKSEHRYHLTLDTLLESCQLLDFDWRYFYLNPAAARQNRRPNAELLGQTMPASWPGIEATPVFALLRKCMHERVPTEGEIEFTFADGTKGWFDVRSRPVPEGIFILSTDITGRVHAERVLRELNESLERKVAERTVELEAARGRAESADRLKSAFLATMSHELRTPLNSILGFTGIVLKGMAGPLNPEQTRQLGMVQGSARHLLDLINDVLDISKIEAGQLEVHRAPFDLATSVERVVGSVTPLADKKGLRLRVGLPPVLPPIDSDRRRVEQILLNLLNNAIKFTERGEVALAIEVDGGASVLKLRVADTGMGISPQDLSQLFQPFRQIDSGLQRQHEGTGLGLAICRRLAGLLGGSIHAESTAGQGSTFTVVLPMQRARAA